MPSRKGITHRGPPERDEGDASALQVRVPGLRNGLALENDNAGLLDGLTEHKEDDALVEDCQPVLGEYPQVQDGEGRFRGRNPNAVAAGRRYLDLFRCKYEAGLADERFRLP